MNKDKEIDDIFREIPAPADYSWVRFPAGIVLFAACVFGVGLLASASGLFEQVSEARPVAQVHAQPTVKDLKIKGNKNSRIYHLSSCPNYNDISSRNVIWFKTTEEAEAAGYRMARNCW